MIATEARRFSCLGPGGAFTGLALRGLLASSGTPPTPPTPPAPATTAAAEAPVPDAAAGRRGLTGPARGTPGRRAATRSAATRSVPVTRITGTDGSPRSASAHLRTTSE
ncbi:hypothetical protein [Streptomyces sp. NPDC048644]|uniref:hypothetical protein n=1 Tax=Streptomyces sp. NPDC048644 TaxID=3365582 RepID=UPI003722C7F2